MNQTISVNANRNVAFSLFQLLPNVHSFSEGTWGIPPSPHLVVLMQEKQNAGSHIILTGKMH